MPKRKAAELNSEQTALRRSTRRKPLPAADTDASTHAKTDTNKIQKRESKAPQTSKKAQKSKLKAAPKSDENTAQAQAQGEAQTQEKSQTKTKKESTSVKRGKTAATKANSDDTATTKTTPQKPSDERWYWLMKAEPESRFENGVDVKFSIDDLAAKTEPEPWDGIRAYAARNNLRSMKKGELAFFYHSNCKEPGLVGTMEIVQEHSPDLSAHDPKAPYYDPSSKPEDPKWSVVHVKFRSKFAQPIGLKELREMGKPGQPLENMQMLKQTRLSVSRVSPSEWEYLMDVVKKRGGEVSDAT
ncbi:PUA-like domain-containing protein [Xylaria sp. FL0043]|nr:PUA-like domain-containing protein [Xylaria sp. FL0043]